MISEHVIVPASPGLLDILDNRPAFALSPGLHECGNTFCCCGCARGHLLHQDQPAKVAVHIRVKLGVLSESLLIP